MLAPKAGVAGTGPSRLFASLGPRVLPVTDGAGVAGTPSRSYRLEMKAAVAAAIRPGTQKAGVAR
jgi:hypothetical protein